MPDVIRFGPRFVAQTDCADALAEVQAEAARRPFKTVGARRGFITRSLQAQGLTVATIAMVRARRYRKPLPQRRTA